MNYSGTFFRGVRTVHNICGGNLRATKSTAAAAHGICIIFKFPSPANAARPVRKDEIFVIYARARTRGSPMVYSNVTYVIRDHHMGTVFRRLFFYRPVTIARARA